MKSFVLIFISIIVYANVNSQFGAQQIISTNAQIARSVFAADLDGDGDIDVLSSSQQDDKIAWYENTDGLGSFGTEQIISTNSLAARNVFASDLDGDNDTDVLSTSFFDLFWFKNTDGLGSFSTEQTITSDVIEPRSVITSDLDGDLDMDIISASLSDDKIAWYENMDGLGSFGAQKIISTSTDGPNSIFATDIDGDGDMDIISASINDDKIAWYENTDGLGGFGTQQIITTNFDQAFSVYAIDIDGDLDKDVVAASNGDDKIAWYENMDGLGTFGPEKIISTDADQARSVFASDIDGDGDMDVLSASRSDDKIAWYENMDGHGSFGTQQIISDLADGAQWVIAADLDGDKDMDVLSASEFDNKIAWYENLSTVSVNENTFMGFSVYPIPTTGILNIKSKEKITHIEIFNRFGQIILNSSLKNKIDISELNPGLYFIKINDENRNSGINKIIKK